MADVSDSTASRLDRVETEISKHRDLYLRAYWAGHEGESEHHRKEVDRLLGVWQRVRAGIEFAELVHDTDLAIDATDQMT